MQGVLDEEILRLTKNSLNLRLLSFLLLFLIRLYKPRTSSLYFSLNFILWLFKMIIKIIFTSSKNDNPSIHEIKM